MNTEVGLALEVVVGKSGMAEEHDEKDSVQVEHDDKKDSVLEEQDDEEDSVQADTAEAEAENATRKEGRVGD